MKTVAGPALAKAPRTARSVGSRVEAPLLPGLPTRRFVAIFACLCAVSVLPIVCCEIPSVTDYLNHLARAQVLRNPDGFGAFYEARWAALPNLAVDGVVVALATVMPLAVAGKVFLALTVLQLALGAVLLHRHFFGEWSLWPCASFTLLYNRTLLSGLVGYVFGVGLCLLAVTAWLRFRSRPPWQRLVLGVALYMTLFFAHFMAFAIYGLIVFSAELAHVRATPRRVRARSLVGLAVTALQGVPPLLVFLLLTPRSEGPARIVFRSLWSRIEAFATPVYVYDPALDLALAALLLTAIVHGTWTRRLAAPREIVYAIIAVCAVHLALPNVVLTLEGADRRLPLVAALLFFAGTRLDVRRSRATKAILVAVVVLFLGRTAGVLGCWQSDQVAYDDARAAMGPVEPGSKVLAAYPHDALDRVKRSVAVYYVPVWETVRRDGFAPGLFAFATQQPVRMTPEYAELAKALPPPRVWESLVGPPGTPLGSDERRALARYDYVVLVNNKPFAIDRALGLVPVVDRPCAKLYRVPR